MGAENLRIHLVANNSLATQMADGGQHRGSTIVQNHKSLASVQKALADHPAGVLVLQGDDPLQLQFCQECKKQYGPALRVLLSFSSVITGSVAEAVRASGCDDVLGHDLDSTEINIDDLWTHISALTGLSLRSFKRVEATLAMKLKQGSHEVEGTVVNISSSGVGFQLADSLQPGKARVSLIHEAREYSSIDGRVVWCHKVPHGYMAGFATERTAPEVRTLMSGMSQYKIVRHDESEVTVFLQGGFNEESNFAPLLAAIGSATRVEFQMSRLDYISSVGVRAWCLFLKSLPPECKYFYSQASISFCAQTSMVPMLAGSGRFRSLYAPYICTYCDREDARLLDASLVWEPAKQGLAKTPPCPPPLTCHLCSRELEFDDIPERFFAFLG